MSCEINTRFFESMFEDPNNHEEICKIKQTLNNYILCTCNEEYWDMQNVIERWGRDE